MSEWDKIHQNPPENWRESWNDRVLLVRYDTRKSAEKYASKHQLDYPKKLQVDLHPKDGYVVYYDRDKTK